jgi:hypothetical protein
MAPAWNWYSTISRHKTQHLSAKSNALLLFSAFRESVIILLTDLFKIPRTEFHIHILYCQVSIQRLEDEYLPSWRKVVLLSRTSSHFKDPECSLRIQKNPRLDFIPSQKKPVHVFTSYSFRTNFNIILPSMPRCLNWFLPFKFPNSDFMCICHFAMCITIHALNITLIVLWTP